MQRALAREREHAEFRDEASAVLMASLNLERCMAATVEMAARHLADAAVVVAPCAEGKVPVVSCASDGAVAVEFRTVDASPADVGGLGEALRGLPPVPSRWIDPASVLAWLPRQASPARSGPS